MESLNLQILAVLMPFEIKCHTVPHLKTLTPGIEHRSGHGQANILRWQKISLKSTPHFISYTDQTVVSFDRICIFRSPSEDHTSNFKVYIFRSNIPLFLHIITPNFQNMGSFVIWVSLEIREVDNTHSNLTASLRNGDSWRNLILLLTAKEAIRWLTSSAFFWTDHCAFVLDCSNFQHPNFQEELKFWTSDWLM